MNKITQALIEAALAPSTTQSQLDNAFACLTGKPLERSASLPELVTRTEAARLLKKSPRRCDQLAREGYLQRVSSPGGIRAMGYSLASVRAVLEGKADRHGKEV
jgi:hypothetical protein